MGDHIRTLMWDLEEHCKIKDDEIKRLSEENEKLQADLDLVYEHDSNLIDGLKRLKELIK